MKFLQVEFRLYVVWKDACIWITGRLQKGQYVAEAIHNLNHLSDSTSAINNNNNNNNSLCIAPASGEPFTAPYMTSEK